jgi:2-C-methyl-D-erythritol 4-phosphate cytidylyltransferase
MKTIALIPAAGQGKRFGNKIKKQFCLIDSKPIIVHTLNKFQKCKDIDEIILALSKEDLKVWRHKFKNECRISKLIKIISGGEKRQDTVFKMLKAVKADEEDIIVIHDGARPFIADNLISRSVRQAVKYGAVVTALPITDTVKEVSSSGKILKTLNRNILWSAQTPQTFKYKIIKEAYLKAKKLKSNATDDGFLVEKILCPVRILRGDFYNIKITNKQDLELGKIIYKFQKKNS